jgi:hypothetical protein
VTEALILLICSITGVILDSVRPAKRMRDGLAWQRDIAASAPIELALGPVIRTGAVLVFAVILRGERSVLTCFAIYRGRKLLHYLFTSCAEAESRHREPYQVFVWKTKINDKCPTS